MYAMYAMYVMLCYVMLCCVVLCSVMLCYVCMYVCVSVCLSVCLYVCMSWSFLGNHKNTGINKGLKLLRMNPATATETGDPQAMYSTCSGAQE